MRTRSERGQPAVRQLLGWYRRETWSIATGVWKVSSRSPVYFIPSKPRYEEMWVCWDELHPGPPYRTGGPLDMFTMRHGLNGFQTLNGMQKVTDTASSKVYDYYDGCMVPNWAPTSPPDLAGFQTWFATEFPQALSSHTSGTISKFSPLKPRVDLGQTLYEIREIPSMLKSTAQYYYSYWRRKGGHFSRTKPWYKTGRNTASEWLNVNFGWLPFLGTIHDVYKTTVDIEQIIARLREYNGKWEKRGGVLEKVAERAASTEHTSTVNANCFPYLPNTLGGTNGSSSLEIEKTRLIKFSARYKYYIPDLLPDGKWPPRLIAHLYGLDLSPKLVYDLIPYSWLVDWFTGLGNIIEAASPSKFGELVTNGAYLTGTYNYRYLFSSFKKCGTNLIPGFWTADIIRKQRIAAPSPYGFDIPLEGLSSWQLSILTALGWNRLTKAFRRGK